MPLEEIHNMIPIPDSTNELEDTVKVFGGYSTENLYNNPLIGKKEEIPRS